MKTGHFSYWLEARLPSLCVCCMLAFSTFAGSPGSTAGPLDFRHEIPAAAFEKSAEGEWTSPTVQSPFPFNELVYSWHLGSPGDSFRLYLKATFAPGDETDWLYAGYWGQPAELIENRTPPKFARGLLDMDFLKLRSKAASFRFKVVASGNTPLLFPPALTVIATDTEPPSSGLLAKPETVPLRGRVLDIPLRRQFNSSGQRMKDRCQSAALASAMEYYGKSVPLEAITSLTYDPEYRYPGIWPRVLAAAQEFGFDGYIERFRNWDQVRASLKQNKVVLCSMRLEKGECQNPPYESMGNHIVALCGVTDDGRVIVTDSALGKSGTGYLCQWLQPDFEKVWMRRKGGVAMVICPPPGATERLVKQLPKFPFERRFPVGDDH